MIGIATPVDNVKNKETEKPKDVEKPKDIEKPMPKTAKNPLVESLTKKIAGTELFIAIVTKNYLEALRSMDGDIITQISIARELERPFFIIEDSRLSKKEIEEARRYFSNDNIIREMTMNINDDNSMNRVATEIKSLAGGKDVEIATQF